MRRLAAPSCLVTLLSLALAACPPARAAEPPPAAPKAPPAETGREVDLRPRFRKGDQTRFIMTIDNTGELREPGQKPSKATPKPRPGKSKTPDPATAGLGEQTMKQEIGLLLRVKEADPEKGATVELVYESLKVDLRSQDMEVSFDSTKKPASKPAAKPGDPTASMPTEQDIVDAMLRPMVGTVITLELDADGNITRTSGGSALSMSGMLSAMSGMTGSPMPSAGAGGDALGSLFSIAKGRGSAAVGESWTTEDTLDNAVIGSFKLTNKTTLKSHNRGIAELAFSGKISPGSQSSPGPLSGAAQVKESDFTGQAQWDTQRGMLKSMTSDQRIEMDATIPDADAGQRAVNMTSRTKVTVKRID